MHRFAERESSVTSGMSVKLILEVTHIHLSSQLTADTLSRSVHALVTAHT